MLISDHKASYNILVAMDTFHMFLPYIVHNLSVCNKVFMSQPERLGVHGIWIVCLSAHNSIPLTFEVQYLRLNGDKVTELEL